MLICSSKWTHNTTLKCIDHLLNCLYWVQLDKLGIPTTVCAQIQKVIGAEDVERFKRELELEHQEAYSGGLQVCVCVCVCALA